jgi:hypothetical protein
MTAIGEILSTPNQQKFTVEQQDLAIPQQEQVREMAGMTIRGDAPERSGEEELRGVRKMEGMTIRGGRGGRDR